MAHQLVLVVKATRLCNLRCDYCHDWRAGPGNTMPDEVLKVLIERSFVEPAHRFVDFTWHGGEPTLLGIEWFERALAMQARARRPGQAVRNALQTNGTGLNDRWAAFLRAYGFAVAVSLDGPREIHDSQRLDVRGRPTFDRVLEGLEVLRRRGVHADVLAVVDRRGLELGAEAYFRSFIDAGIRSFGLYAAQPQAETGMRVDHHVDHYVTRSEMTSFLCDLHDVWQRNGDRSVLIRELSDIERRLAGVANVSCTLAGACVGNLFSVEPNGDVSHCDEYVGDDAYRVGSILNQTWSQIRSSVRLRALADDDRRAVEGYAGCPERAVCNGWCPHQRYMAARHDPAGVDPGCCGLRPLIEHIRDGQGQAVAIPGRPRAAISATS